MERDDGDENEDASPAEGPGEPPRRGLLSRAATLTKLRQTVADSARQVQSAAKEGSRRVSDEAREAYRQTQESASRAAVLVGKGGERASAFIKDSAGGIAAFLAQPELLKWSESVTESAATIYDVAMDATYLREHIGGGHHRMFDGGHDLVAAWGRVRNASEVDTFGDEVIGYVQGIWKDGTTSNGLPFLTWDQADYGKIADQLTRVPGVSRAWVYDLLSYDVFEVFAAGLGAVGILFALQHDDLERLSELLGTMGITSIISANPILGLTVILTTGYAYWRKGREGGSLELSARGVATGAGMAGFSAALFAVLGLPVLVELGIVLVASQLARTHVVENEVLHEIVSSAIQTSSEGAMRSAQRVLVVFQGMVTKRFVSGEAVLLLDATADEG